MRYLGALLICIVFLAKNTFTCFGQIVGTIDTLKAIGSAQVTPRDIYIWQPTTVPPNTKFKILLMHDGQMLFDGANTWNKQEWRADEVADSLIQLNKCTPFIIVGVCNNTATRYRDYYPENCFMMLDAYQQNKLQTQAKGEINSDNYLKYITENVLPLIYQKYNVYKQSPNVIIGGSSMGGLISWYAQYEYPQIFGGAMCMSTHWPGGNIGQVKDTLFDTFKMYIDNSNRVKNMAIKGKKFYFDYGGQTLDSSYSYYQIQIDEIFAQNKYPKRNYKVINNPTHKHDEVAWSERLPQAMLYFFAPTSITHKRKKK
jgi:predicted alpha/beta superfamily hydrolase